MGTAEAIAKRLVSESCAAGVNIVPGLRSVYLWRDALQTDDEVLLMIKTRDSRYPALEAAILDAHPYELPEIVCVPIVAGLSGYLSWIQDTVSSAR
jgi:periplasmic divalent cation tolerance protein